MTTIITYGTFDLFHIGHLNLLKRLSALGSRLVVGVSTDDFNEIKGKTTIMPYEHRAEIVSSLRFVDHVFPEMDWNQKRADILREGAQIFAMGEDWAGKFDSLGDICKVIYLPRTQDVSTTEIKKIVKSLHQDKVEELKHSVQRLQMLVDRL